MVMRMKVLDAAFKSVLNEFFDYDQNMFLLGLVVEFGVDKFLEGSPQTGLSEQEMMFELKKLVSRVPFQFLLQEQNFLMFLQLRIARTYISGEGSKNRGKILKDLSLIFGKENAELLYHIACENYRENLAKGKDYILQLSAAFVQFKKEQLARIPNLSTPIFPKPVLRVRKEKGTETSLILCPQCKTSKRCDENTKRFRCKCGYDSPYPFSK